MQSKFPSLPISTWLGFFHSYCRLGTLTTAPRASHALNSWMVNVPVHYFDLKLVEFMQGSKKFDTPSEEEVCQLLHRYPCCCERVENLCLFPLFVIECLCPRICVVFLHSDYVCVPHASAVQLWAERGVERLSWKEDSIYLVHFAPDWLVLLFTQHWIVVSDLIGLRIIQVPWIPNSYHVPESPLPFGEASRFRNPLIWVPFPDRQSLTSILVSDLFDLVGSHLTETRTFFRNTQCQC